jgi:hypothetical protein
MTSGLPALATVTLPTYFALRELVCTATSRTLEYGLGVGFCHIRPVAQLVRALP